MNQTLMDEDNPAETSQQEESKTSSLVEDKKPEFDCRKYRQFRVTVYIDIRNVLGHLVKVKWSFYYFYFVQRSLFIIQFLRLRINGNAV